ncbi:MAG: CPBP family intramembrane metalloprotease [Lachnospiraceae bacterium]
MTTKRANWLFLTIILVHVGVVVLLNFAGDRIPIGIVANFFLAQAIVMAPTLLFLFAFERGGRSAGRSEEGLEAYGMPSAVCGVNRPLAAAGFHKVKITTLLMIMLCTFLIMPLVALCNAVSLFFTDNTMASMQGNIVDMPFSVMLFMIGIFGPFCEEFVFRGVFYRSYRADGAGTGIGKAGVQGGGIRAILLSALLFGLMHMNFNQALYAFVMGIFLAVLVEAAGSLWASVFCHMFFNSVEGVLMYV